MICKPMTLPSMNDAIWGKALHFCVFAPPSTHIPTATESSIYSTMYSGTSLGHRDTGGRGNTGFRSNGCTGRLSHTSLGTVPAGSSLPHDELAILLEREPNRKGSQRNRPKITNQESPGAA